ncbi:MAG: Gfo/Idh/MocA family oxidoreductase [Pseudomonadota bacterium]
MNRILVAGGGLIGIRHCAAVSAHPRCELAGLADPNPDIHVDAPRFADIADAPDDIDGIIIATPTALHAELGAQAARRGWHMLIEKPVAADLKGAEALARAARKAKVNTLVGHHRRYHALVQQLRQMLRKGAIGTPVTASLIWAMGKPDSYFDGNWRATGGSPVMINLVHDIDLLRFVLGDITAVRAVRGADRRGADRISSGAVAIAFDSGVTGSIAFTDNAPSPWGFEAATGENPNIGATRQDMLWITGTEGAVSFPSLDLWQGIDWSCPAMRRPVSTDQNKQPPLTAQLDHFLDVMGGATPFISMEDATRTLAVTLDIEDQLHAAQPTARAHEPA